MVGGKITNILIAEDDSVLKDLYMEWLPEILHGSTGIVVSFITNGSDASEALSKKKYDLTVLDMALPNISGLDLYRRHRDKMGKLVIASSYATIFSKYLKSDEKYSILNKPFGKKELSSILRNLLEVDNAYTGTSCDSQEYISV